MLDVDKNGLKMNNEKEKQDNLNEENSAYENFKTLAQKLLKVDKDEVEKVTTQEKNKQECEKPHKSVK